MSTATPPLAGISEADAFAEAAAYFVKGGLSLVPCDHASKRPDARLLPKIDGKPSWKPFQNHAADESIVRMWCKRGCKAVAVVCGKVSGGVLIIDFDVARFYDAWLAKVGSLASGLPTQQTGGGGYQVALRCPNPGGNDKLAWCPDEKEPTGRTIAIETRAEGGYAVLPGSLHPSGKYYRTIAGHFDKIPAIPQEQADALLAMARALDEAPITKPDIERRQASAKECTKYRSEANGQTSIIDAYNHAVDIDQALGSHGYTQSGDRWTRPGGSNLSVFVQDGRSFHHSTNDPLTDGYWHRAFDVFCLLSHSGDCKSAVKAAAQALGIQSKPRSANTTPLPTEPGTIVYATDKGNWGDVVADLGDSCSVHFRNPADGNEATVTLPKSKLRTQDGKMLDGSAVPIEVMRASELLDKHPRLRPSTIDGLARKGETVNIVSVSKVGKSWLGYTLLLSVATGRPWLDTFACERGRVLLIDNELHKETLARRLSTAAEAMGLRDSDWRDSFDIVSLRGQLVDWYGLSDGIHGIERDAYAVVLADAWYRFLPPGVDENSNAEVAQLYNLLDQYAEHLGAAWVNIHHSSKGDQSGKSVTDVGAGAGSQSRAADSHLILRPHEEDGVVVMEAVVRSFPPVEPVPLRWEYPLWLRADGVDPRRLRQPMNARQKQQQAADDEGMRQIAATLAKHRCGTATAICRWTVLSRERCQRLLNKLESDGQIVRTDAVVAGNRCAEYRPADLDNEVTLTGEDQQQSIDFENTNDRG